MQTAWLASGMKDGAQVAAIRNNSLLSNGDAGIGHNGSVKRVVVGEESGNTIESNRLAGIGMIHAKVDLISMNIIRSNGAPGITVTEDSDVGLIEGSAATEGPERLSQNGRGDLQDPITSSSTAGLVVLGEGSTTNISNLIVEGSGMVNVMLGAGTLVNMDGCTIRNNNHGPNLRIDGRATVTNSLFENAKAPGVGIFGDNAFVSFNDNIISESGTAGMIIDNGPTIESFAGNQILQAGTAGLLLGAITGDINIVDSDIYGSGTIGILSSGMVQNVTITDSYVRDSGTMGVYLLFGDTSKSFNILGSHIIENGMMGIIVENSANLTIADSTIADNAAAIRTSNIDNVEVTNSTFRDNRNGLALDNDSNPSATCTVSGSLFDNNLLGVDIGMAGGSQLSVYDTIISGTGESGSDGGSAIEAVDVDAVDIVGSDLKSWNIGISIKRVGQANVSKSRIRARWPMKFEDSSGNITNTITSTESMGYIFDNSVINFYHNTMYGGTHCGLNAGNNSIVHAYNNIITGVHMGFRSGSGAVVTADYNLMHDNTFNYHAVSPGIINWGTNNLVNTDPELVDPLNEDFHLKPSSRAIDAGDSEIEVADDMDSDSRPQGASSDIGADEAM